VNAEEMLREIFRAIESGDFSLGYSTHLPRTPADISKLTTRPAAELSTDQQQDGATRQTPEEIR